MTAGFLNQDYYGKLAGIGVGLFWLGGTAALTFLYQPYNSGVSKVSGMPKNTPREKLYRERVAESEIEFAASLGRRIKWISAISNIGAGAYMIIASGADLQQKGIAGAAIITALLPFVFSSHWITVAEEQADYKKKIYGPLADATAAPIFNLSENKLGPGLALIFPF